MRISLNLALAATLSFGAATTLLPQSAQAGPTEKLQTALTQIPVDPQTVVPEIVALGILPEVYKMRATSLTESRLKNLTYLQDRYLLSVGIGRVNAQQFAKLKALYGGLSAVSYDSQRNYNLIDFLPPAIQATVNKTFTQTGISGLALGDVETSDEVREELWGIQKNGVNFFTNCWGTTTEVLRSLRARGPKNPFTLAWPARWTADDHFRNEKYSSTINESSIQFGDVLTVSQKTGEDVMLQHTAFVINKALVFEKTDTMDDDPYRLSLRADVLSKYKEVFKGEEVFQYRRFSVDKEIIPTETAVNPAEYFSPAALKVLRETLPQVPVNNLTFGCETGLGGGCDPTANEIRVIDIVIDPQTGRGVLNGDAEVLKHFRPL